MHHSNEVNELHYLFLSNNRPPQFPSRFGNITPSSSSYHHQLQINDHQIHPKSTSFSSNSTSDEADEQQISSIIINERKQRRMLSNRESARRSRMRKQKHLDELWSQVVWLQNENRQLMDRLNSVSESHEQAVQENAQLKEETTELRQTVAVMKLGSPFNSMTEIADDA